MGKPSVILLSIDALRADHFGYHGYEWDTSPFLDALAERIVSFITAISASSHTREAMPSLLSGEYLEILATNDYRYAIDTIADHLLKTRFQTAGSHSNPHLFRTYEYDNLFNTSDNDLQLSSKRIIVFLQRALNKLFPNKRVYHVQVETIYGQSHDRYGSAGGESFSLFDQYMNPHRLCNPIEGTISSNSEISNQKAY